MISKKLENPYSSKPWLKNYDLDVPPSIDYPVIPVYQILYNSARDFSDRLAADFMGRKWTYKQIRGEVDSFATALTALGVGKGDRVAIALPTIPQFAVAYYGILRAGGVVVAVNPVLTPPELDHILNDSGAEAIIAYDMLMPVLRGLKPKTKLKQIIVTSLKDALPGATKPKLVDGAHQYFDLIEEHRPNPPEVVINPKDDPAAIQYTGGTTGIPKGAILTHYNFVVNAVQLAKWYTVLEKGVDSGLMSLPLFHALGMTTMNFGVLLALTRSFNPDPRDFTTLLSLIRQFRPSTISVVPTMLIRMMQHEDFEKTLDALKNMKYCTSGAAPMPPGTIKTIENYGINLVEAYGLTECTCAATANPLKGGKKIGSVGMPLSDTAAMIVDVETHSKPMPIGEPGELVFKGPQVMKEYWNKPEETRKQLVDKVCGVPGPWVFTGDIAKMDGDGYFYIVDRTKDMINVSGLKVFAREVDDVLCEHPAVAMAATVGVPDPKTLGAETVKAFIVLKETNIPSKETEESIIEHCRKHLTRYKVPKFVEFRKELPLSLIGKVLKRPLREEELKKASRAA